MSDDVRYAEIKPADTRQVVAVHRAASRADHVARSIYSSPKVHHYLATLVEHPELASRHLLLGAWRGDTLVGFAHGRALESTWHLNEIGTLPAVQGRGIGRALFEWWLTAGLERNFRSFSLDVEQDNRAMRWYLRRGFAPAETSWAYEKSLRRGGRDLDGEEQSTPMEAGSVQLGDWENAHAWQRAFGFSRFTLTAFAHTWSIDRLGRKYFRVREQLPSAIERTLGRLDGRRRLLIVQSTPLNNEEPTPVSVSIRMLKQAG